VRGQEKKIKVLGGEGGLEGRRRTSNAPIKEIKCEANKKKNSAAELSHSQEEIENVPKPRNAAFWGGR